MHGAATVREPVGALRTRSALVRSFLIWLVALAPVGCGDTPAGPGPIDRLPRELTAGERELVASANDFSFRLFGALAAEEPEENVFVSPLSVSMALGMTMNGARGETLSQMRSTLGFGSLPMEEIDRSYRDLIDLLLGLDPHVETGLGNSIWYREGFPIEAEFLETNRRYFHAEIAGLDFSSPGAVSRINRWVDEVTRGRIPTILETIPQDVVLYLINAIYFKGAWTYRFDPERTREAPFRLEDGTTATVSMMNRDSIHLYAETDLAWAVELPYGGGAFAMVVVLPPAERSLSEVIHRLDGGGWDELLERLDERRVLVGIPRFELEYETTLNEVLISLGMPDAFSPARADFGGISSAPLWIDEAKQKAFVKVDEEGTEAAAATIVAMATSMPPEFRADRPFLFAIRERLTGTILFVGRFARPPE